MVASCAATFYFAASEMTSLLIIMLRFYKQWLSPLVHALGGPGCGCRFEPTCSAYFAEALQEHGLVQGAAMGIARICRCHPWGGCGYDPVPSAFKPTPHTSSIH